jgi:hypothetical protein
MLVIWTSSNVLKEPAIPIAQKAAAIAMTMETDTMMMVAIMVLMPSKLRFSFLFVNVHLRFSSERSFDNVTVTAYN